MAKTTTPKKKGKPAKPAAPTTKAFDEGTPKVPGKP